MYCRRSDNSTVGLILVATLLRALRKLMQF